MWGMSRKAQGANNVLKLGGQIMLLVKQGLLVNFNFINGKSLCVGVISHRGRTSSCLTR